MECFGSFLRVDFKKVVKQKFENQVTLLNFKFDPDPVRLSVSNNQYKTARKNSKQHLIILTGKFPSNQKILNPKLVDFQIQSDSHTDGVWSYTVRYSMYEFLLNMYSSTWDGVPRFLSSNCSHKISHIWPLYSRTARISKTSVQQQRGRSTAQKKHLSFLT